MFCFVWYYSIGGRLRVCEMWFVILCALSYLFHLRRWILVRLSMMKVCFRRSITYKFSLTIDCVEGFCTVIRWFCQQTMCSMLERFCLFFHFEFELSFLLRWYRIAISIKVHLKMINLLNDPSILIVIWLQFSECYILRCIFWWTSEKCLLFIIIDMQHSSLLTRPILVHCLRGNPFSKQSYLTIQPISSLFSLVMLHFHLSCQWFS
jgi:hypothetical protein